jgi:hypothetical protein
MGFNFFKKDKNKWPQPSTKVYRKKIVEGFSIPAIIHNDQYFFVDIDVYEDGRVDCWNFEDWEHFKKDVQRGWVVINIPDNQTISIHGLGAWEISGGSWQFNHLTFISYVESLIKILNPNWVNIYQVSEKKVNGVIIGESAGGKVFRELGRSSNEPFPEKLKGESVDLFYKIKDSYFLVKMNVFENSTIQLSRLEVPVDLDFMTLQKLADEKTLVTDPPTGSEVHIYGLGSFILTKAFYLTDIKNKLLEINDLLRKAKGEPTTIQLCREAYEDYLANPTVAAREKLKITYEQVPEHERLYVGDMDTKDIPIRMIIYGDQEIENWSHFLLSKELDEELPSITVPKPVDDPGVE